jgi:uncharacterized RDD family membrane protein YckC
MRYAGVGLRAVAVIVDGLVTFLGLGIPIALLSGQTSSGNGTVGFNLHGGPAFIWIALSFAYWIVLEAAFGRTLGKRILGLRVERAEGGPIGWGQSVARNLLRIVDVIPFVVPYLLGAIVAWAGGERRQRIGDRAAGTVVTRD